MIFIDYWFYQLIMPGNFTLIQIISFSLVADINFNVFHCSGIQK